MYCNMFYRKLGKPTSRLIKHLISLQYANMLPSLRKGQYLYQWRFAEMRCLLVENYSNSRRVLRGTQFLEAVKNGNLLTKYSLVYKL